MRAIVERIGRRIGRLNRKKWRQSFDDMLRLDTVEERFDRIYAKNLWRNVESASGSGSTLKFTRNLREALPELVKQYKIKRLFDAPCGDFNWMRHALQQMDIHYIGGDIVESLIVRNRQEFSQEGVEFIRINLISERFPESDMMLCRDCLFHMSFADTLSILQNFIASKTRYLFTTTYQKSEPFSNEDIITGSYRPIDLCRAPYHFPKDPLYAVLDGKKDNSERFMCLWDREQVVVAVKAMAQVLEPQ